MKKKILGRSETWPTSHLSHWPSEPAYCISDCRISYTANVNRQTTDKLLFSYAIITGENV